MSGDPLRELILVRLVEELGPGDWADRLTDQVIALSLSWRPAARPAAEFDTIIAYAFGNRLTGGEPAPGPVNAALARAVAALNAVKPMRVFVQWEIGRCLAGMPAMRDVTSIEPVTGADGAVEYLSTDGVAQDILRRVGGDAGALGRVAVIAHRDHAKRCVEISRRVGMDASIAEEIDLPVDYDPLSGQAWTRGREAYLAHDLAARWLGARNGAIASQGLAQGRN